MITETDLNMFSNLVNVSTASVKCPICTPATHYYHFYLLDREPNFTFLSEHYITISCHAGKYFKWR